VFFPVILIVSHFQRIYFLSDYNFTAARLTIFTAMKIQVMVFCDGTPCSDVHHHHTVWYSATT